MIKYAWIAALVCAVFILGAVGNDGIQEGPDLPGTQMYSDLQPDVSDNGYVSVTLHDLSASVSLPAEKQAALPGDRKNRLFPAELLEDNTVTTSFSAGMEDDEHIGRADKKKARGFLLPREADDSIGASTGGFADKDNGGWGNGWLGEAIFSEEKRGRGEVDQHEMSFETESVVRESRSSDSDRGIAPVQDSFMSGRFSEGSLFDRGRDSKTSFKPEPWRMQKK